MISKANNGKRYVNCYSATVPAKNPLLDSLEETKAAIATIEKAFVNVVAIP
jgi:hypothetical protein